MPSDYYYFLGLYIIDYRLCCSCSDCLDPFGIKIPGVADCVVSANSLVFIVFADFLWCFHIDFVDGQV